MSCRLGSPSVHHRTGPQKTSSAEPVNILQFHRGEVKLPETGVSQIGAEKPTEVAHSPECGPCARRFACVYEIRDRLALPKIGITSCRMGKE
jgi:hypothetical protein